MGWAEKNFFPYIEAQREYYDYTGESLVILDGFGPHDCDAFLDECSYKGIIVLPLPPHSSDQCQPLDLGIFHVQKGRMQRLYIDPKLSPQTQQLIKMLDSLKQVCITSNVVNAFKCTGIKSKYDKEKQMFFPYFDRSSASKVRHFNFTNDSEYDKSRLPVLKDDDHVIQPKTKKVPLKKKIMCST